MKEMIYKPEREAQILAEGEYKGYHFVIVSYGTHPCAYVEIPKDNPLYKKDYEDIDISCHCGLTFSDDLTHVRTDLTGWFIGWDYAHVGDYIGSPTSYYEKELFDGKKWTTEEVYEEVKNVIEQLIHYFEKGEDATIMSDETLIISALKGHIRVNEKLGIIEIYDEYGTKSVLRDVDPETLDAFKKYFQIF